MKRQRKGCLGCLLGCIPASFLALIPIVLFAVPELLHIATALAIIAAIVVTVIEATRNDDADTNQEV